MLLVVTIICGAVGLGGSFLISAPADLPLFSYGQSPSGHWWNVLFGLTGYERKGEYANVKAFWLPIQVDSPKTTATR